MLLDSTNGGFCNLFVQPLPKLALEVEMCEEVEAETAWDPLSWGRLAGCEMQESGTVVRG